MKKIITDTSVSFTFDNLADGTPVPPISFDVRVLSDANRQRCIPFAMGHRLGDAAALSRTDSKGNVRPITEAMKRAEIETLVNHYESGSDEWSPKASARQPAQNPAILAIAANRKCTYAEAEAWIVEESLRQMMSA